MHTFDSRCFSDLHKDVYGYRPSQEWSKSVDDMCDDEKQKVWDDLVSKLEKINEVTAEEQELEHKRRLANAEVFERFICTMISRGKTDRKAALEWVRQNQPAHMRDCLSICYTFGLPLGYLSQKDME